MKRITAVILTVILATTLFGCAKNDDSELCVYAGGGVTSLDPLRCDTKAAQTYIANMFCGLYSYSVDENGLPILVCEDAESLPTVKQLEGGLYELTFKLRDGLLWSNGEKLLPEDYVYSWNRAVKYFVFSDKSYIFEMIDGYDSFVKYDEDASLNMSYDNKGMTFTVVLNEDSERFLSYTTETLMFPVSRIAVRDSDGWDSVAEDFASNGRYTLESLSSKELILVKNQNYSGGHDECKERVRFIFDIDDAEKLFDRSRLSFARLDEDTSLMLHKNKSVACGVGYIAFNDEDPALGLYTSEEKAKIRRAIAIYIANSGAFGEENASLSPSIQVGNAFYSLSEEEADRLLYEVSESSGRFTSQDGVVYEFPILTALSAGRSTEQRKWRSVAEALKEQGITLQVTNCTWEDFLLSAKEGSYSMLFNTWIYNTPSGGEVLSLFTSGSAYDFTHSGEEMADYCDMLRVSCKSAGEASARQLEALKILEERGLVLPVINTYAEYYYGENVKVSAFCDGIIRFYK